MLVIYIFFLLYYNQNLVRVLHSGSALAFQARGAGSIPAIRSNCKITKECQKQLNFFGGRSQVVRQWIVTPPFAGSTPVIRQFLSF